LKGTLVDFIYVEDVLLFFLILERIKNVEFVFQLQEPVHNTFFSIFFNIKIKRFGGGEVGIKVLEGERDPFVDCIDSGSIKPTMSLSDDLREASNSLPQSTEILIPAALI